jgi:hypothetical protein
MLLAAAHPCMDDAQKLCPGVKPGGGRISACLKEHKDQLSAECNARIAQFKEDAEVCKADVEKLCPGTKPGQERHQCMQSHKDEVSPECKEFFARIMQGRERREAMHACHGDAQKLCKDVKPGEGRIADCLKSHQSELSPACASSLQ